MCQGSAADPDSTPGLGPFAVCHYPSLSPVSCCIFIWSINKAIKRPNKYLKKNIQPKAPADVKMAKMTTYKNYCMYIYDPADLVTFSEDL